MNWEQVCVSCSLKYKGDEIRYRCDCGEMLEIKINFPKIDKDLFYKRFKESGVWRFKELLPAITTASIVSKPEGNTNIYEVGSSVQNGYSKIGQFVNSDKLYLKHEGENPTGSFKDRGMTVGISQAKSLKVKAVACASTGNTSASLASYAAQAGLRCFVFIPEGKISISKLSQALAYGAKTIQIEGDFDQAMETVQKVCNEFNIYLLNSINPFRIEGQKTILFELLQQLDWKVPDWIVLPGGNLGNTSAIGKALFELREVGIIKKLPRIAVIQANGANPFYQSYQNNFKKVVKLKAETVASAIRIGNPVSFIKAKKVIIESNGIVEEVTDQEILDAKAIVDSSGIGCEPASAATVAGIKKLISKKIINKRDTVVGILTGHILKDPDTIIGYHKKELAGINSNFSNRIIKIKNISKDLVKIISLKE